MSVLHDADRAAARAHCSALYAGASEAEARGRAELRRSRVLRRLSARPSGLTPGLLWLAAGLASPGDRPPIVSIPGPLVFEQGPPRVSPAVAEEVGKAVEEHLRRALRELRLDLRF